jgi:hypothetical protein
VGLIFGIVFGLVSGLVIGLGPKIVSPQTITIRNPSEYEREYAVDLAQLTAFLEATQPEMLTRTEAAHSQSSLTRRTPARAAVPPPR